VESYHSTTQEELLGAQAASTMGMYVFKQVEKNQASVRDFPQKVKVEDVKTKLSCETSLKK